MQRTEQGKFGRRPNHDPFLDKWLKDNFASIGTRYTYSSAFNRFCDLLGISDLKTYLEGLTQDQAQEDFKKFVSTLNGGPSKTTETYMAALRVLYADHGIEIKNMRKLRRRGFLPKRVKAQTQDRPPEPEELKKIVAYMSLQGQALTLFLASSGCRVGESLQIRPEEICLDADPPRAFIRGETTKNGVSERTIFFSYEARDAIRNWLELKAKKRTKTGQPFLHKTVFGISYDTYLKMFREATRKAELVSSDLRTKRTLIHPHTLRKFFRNRIKLERDFTEALMGHVEGLDEAYRRVDLDEIARMYQANMANVSIYVNEALTDSKLQARIKELEDQVKQLEDKKEAENEALQQNFQKLVNDLAGKGYIDYFDVAIKKDGTSRLSSIVLQKKAKIEEIRRKKEKELEKDEG